MVRCDDVDARDVEKGVRGNQSIEAILMSQCVCVFDAMSFEMCPVREKPLNTRGSCLGNSNSKCQFKAATMTTLMGKGDFFVVLFHIIQYTVFDHSRVSLIKCQLGNGKNLTVTMFRNHCAFEMLCHCPSVTCLI